MASFTSVAAGADLQAVALYTEIEDSLFHRFDVTGAAGTPGFAVDGGSTVSGDDIQDATFWADRQTAMETLVINAFSAGRGFVSDNGAIGVPASSRLNYSGSIFSSVNFFETAADLWALVVGNGSGPRRVVGAAYPVDSTSLTDPAFSFGKCQAGDIIGPWLTRDLQQALNFLRFTGFHIQNGSFQDTNKVTERDPLNNTDFSPSDRRILKGGAFAPPKSRSMWGRRYVGTPNYNGNWSEIHNSHDFDTFETNSFEPMGSVDENPRIVQGLLSNEMGTGQVERLAKRIYSARYWSRDHCDNAAVLSYTEKGESIAVTDAAITHKADVYSIIGTNNGNGLPLDCHLGHDVNLLPLINGVGPSSFHDEIIFDPHEFGAVSENTYVRINNDASFQSADPRTVTYDPPRDHVRDTPEHSDKRSQGINDVVASIPFYGYILGVDVLWVSDWVWPFDG